MRQDQLAVQASLQALNGLVGNFANQTMTMPELITASIKIGVTFASQWAANTTLADEVNVQYATLVAPVSYTIAQKPDYDPIATYKPTKDRPSVVRTIEE